MWEVLSESVHSIIVGGIVSSGEQSSKHGQVVPSIVTTVFWQLSQKWKIQWTKMHFLYVLFQFMWYKQITLIDPDDHSEWRTTLNPVCQMYIHNSAGYASAEFDNTTYASFIKNCLVPYVARMATCASQVPHIDCSIVYSWRSLRQKLTSSTANLEGCHVHFICGP